jgi:hypothetical protein
MQIKNTLEGNPIKGTSFSYVCNTALFNKDDGRHYYAALKGIITYFFDDPTRIHNLVLVQYGRNKQIVMRICDFIVHLILWRANVVFKDPITDGDIYQLQSSRPDSVHVNTILNNITERLIEKEGEITDPICECICNIKDTFSGFLHGYAAICCNTISVYNIIQFKNRSKEFNRLLNTELDETKSIKELEIQVNECEKQLVKVIKDDKYNCFNPYLRSGRIKSAQLTKVLVAVGTRPDIDKTILPKPIKKGYIHGLQNASEYFMETVTARDAMITKVDNVPVSGALSREVNKLTGNIYINYNIKDCGTNHVLNYTVENQDYLEMIIGKYYYDSGGKLKTVTKKDFHLIGKTIPLRSFICCASREGVCQTCVGKLSKRLIGTRIGPLPAIKIINPLSNKSMSAKHNIGTNSIELTNETLKKYFYNDGADFYINQEYANTKQLYIVINQDDVEELLYSSTIDIDDDTIDTRAQLSYAAIRDKGVDYVIENEGMRIALSDYCISQKNNYIDDPEDTDYMLIPINELDPGSPVFSVILDTEEISKYLNSFIGMVDRKSVAKFLTCDNLMKEINRIVYEAGFKNEIIHYESIIYGMIRSLENATARPDFSQAEVSYQILRISSAIEKKDMYTAISFQGLRRLFKDSTIRRRMGTSLYDPFFRISSLF